MNMSWPGGPEVIGPTLARAVEEADRIGIHSFWPMDHFFQIPIVGGPEEPLLEAYAILGWAAGRTTALQLGTLVTGVHYRHPGLLAKLVTSLDVLSGGRCWLGIGAAWNEEESRGLGVPFPPLAERFERLEETLQIVHQMFDGDDRPFHGVHYQLDRPLNSPPPIRRPPIMIGGGGEKKTLRLVAQYGDATNMFEMLGPEELRRKHDVLRGHCDAVGRPYQDIIKTTFGQLGPPDIDGAVERFKDLAKLGVDLAIVDLPDPNDSAVYDYLGELVERVKPLGDDPER